MNEERAALESLTGDIRIKNVNDSIKITNDPENMEVHHHPDLHHKPKRWKEYFLEFLMIFLAVSLGFIAENLREGIKHKEELKTHIASMLSDLENDILLFNASIERNTYSAQMSDSLIELLHSDIANTRDIYVAARSVTANLGYNYSNAKSFEQMKSSGLLQFIRPANLLDSIGAYYASFQWLNNQTELLRLKVDEIHKRNELLFDSYVFESMMKSGFTALGNRRTIINKPIGQPALLSTSPNDINAVSLSYHYYYSTIKFFINKSVEQRDRAKRLVLLVKKSYPLE